MRIFSNRCLASRKSYYEPYLRSWLRVSSSNTRDFSLFNTFLCIL